MLDPIPSGQPEIELDNVKVEFFEGSITDAATDAIVVPANPKFEYTTRGVQGAVVGEAGNQIYLDCEEEATRQMKDMGVEYLPDAHTISTGSENLEKKGIKHIINVNSMPGMFDREGSIMALTTQSVISSLKAADILRCESIAIPLLNTGRFLLDREKCKDAMIMGVKEYFETLNGESSIINIKIVIFNK